jgi:hypothetical protein
MAENAVNMDENVVTKGDTRNSFRWLENLLKMTRKSEKKTEGRHRHKNRS